MVSGSLLVISETLIRMSGSRGGKDTESEVVLASVEVQGCKLWTAIDWSRLGESCTCANTNEHHGHQIGPARAMMPVHTSHFPLSYCCESAALQTLRLELGNVMVSHTVGGSLGQHVGTAEVST